MVKLGLAMRETVSEPDEKASEVVDEDETRGESPEEEGDEDEDEVEPFKSTGTERWWWT